MQQRPEHFRINPYSHFAQGLVFAGLGNMPGSTHYHDTSLYGNHGVLTNMDPATDWVWDSYLNRFALNPGGTDEYVNCGTPDVVQLGNYSSLSFVCNVKLTSHSTFSLIVSNTSNSNNNWEVTVETNGFLQLRLNTVLQNRTASGFTITDGVWSHIAVTRNSSNVFWYKDGAENTGTVNNATPSTTNQAFRIGSRNGTNFFNGYLSDLLIYSRDLSASEIQKLADPSNVMLSGLLLPPRRRLWAVSGGIADIIEGRVCWGHDTNVEEENILDFEDEWTGTAEIVNAGVDDTEKLVLEDGEYMESVKVVETGVKTVTLQVNKYGEGDEDVVVKYRHAADSASCLEASWNVYTEPFESLGYVQVRLEAPDV